VGFQAENQWDMGRNLQKLLEALQFFKWVKEYKPIFKAQIPVYYSYLGFET
jgi:hypothetical protein